MHNTLWMAVVLAAALSGCGPNPEDRSSSSATGGQSTGTATSSGRAGTQASDSLRARAPGRQPVNAVGTVRHDTYTVAAVSLCWLVDAARAGIGVYEVDYLSVGFETAGVDPNGPSQQIGFAYADLKLVEAWTPKAPDAPTARLWDCSVSDCPVSIKKGERVLLFLDVPSVANAPYYNVGPAWLFQESGGAWSNGSLFTNKPTSLHELRSAVEQVGDALAADGQCSMDVLPPSDAPLPTAEGQPVYEGTFATECVECPDAATPHQPPQQDQKE